MAGDYINRVDQARNLAEQREQDIDSEPDAEADLQKNAEWRNDYGNENANGAMTGL